MPMNIIYREAEPSDAGKFLEYCKRVGAESDNLTFGAEGIPFSGSSQICENCSLPLKAIVYLSQAPETTICPLTGVRAFARIWEGVSVNIWDKEDVEQVSATVQQVLERVPVYHLACTPDESAVSALEQMLRKQVLL